MIVRNTPYILNEGPKTIKMHVLNVNVGLRKVSTIENPKLIRKVYCWNNKCKYIFRVGGFKSVPKGEEGKPQPEL